MNKALTKTLTAGLMHGLVVSDGRTPFGLTIDNFSNVIKYPVKPYLFPMSALTKEIEFKGERFVPIDKLNKILKESKDSDSWIEYDFSEDHFWIHPSAGITGGWEMPLIFDFLHEHHFNVFGLSPDEFIEVNETNNPYKI